MTQPPPLSTAAQALDVDKLSLLAHEVARILNVDTIATDIGIGELGIDSLNIVELIVFCEQLYGAFDPEALTIAQYTTLAELHVQLMAQSAD